MKTFKKVRATAEELTQQIADLMAEADELKLKADTEEGLTEEEQLRLEEIVTQVEELQAQLDALNTEERMARAKARMIEPTRQAPLFARPKNNNGPRTSVGEGLALFLRSNSHIADNSPANFSRCAELGIHLGSNNAQLPVNYRGMQFKKRAILSKGGVGTGKELIFQTYSDKLVEYMTYSSPILGLVGSETTADGNSRTYFIIDPTAMESTDTLASGGTETAPTIPQTNFVTANVVIGTKDITSGKQLVSFNELRDSYVSLEDKIAQANATAHSRKIERDIVSGTGNGLTNVGGIQQACTAITSAADWTVADLERLYFSVPAQYRSQCVWMCNGDTYAAIYSVLKNLNGDSMFGKYIQEDVEFDLLMGKKFLQSDFVADETVLFFNPEMYMLRLVEGQIFQQFVETTFPNVGWAGVISIGGYYIGDPKGAKKLTLTA